MKSPGVIVEKSVPQSSICSTTPMRAAPFSVRPASANAAPGAVNMKSEILRLATATPSTSFSNAGTIDCEGLTGLHSQESKKPQESQGGKGEWANNDKETKHLSGGFNVMKWKCIVHYDWQVSEHSALQLAEYLTE